MTSAEPEHLSSSELWTAQLWVPPELSADDIQETITGYASRRGLPVMGYYQEPNLLTFLHWPGEQEGYRTASVDEADEAMFALTRLLQARYWGEALRRATVHAMLGWYVGEYGHFAPVDSADEDVKPARMLSARVRTDDSVELCTGPVSIVTAGEAREDKIHELAKSVGQTCYTVHRRPAYGETDQTDLYQIAHR